MKGVLQFALQAGKFEKRHAGRQIDEKIHVAVAPLLTASEGTKKPNVCNAVFLRDRKNVWP